MVTAAGEIAIQVSDAVVDARLTGDPRSKGVRETAPKGNTAWGAGDSTLQAKIDYERAVRGVVAKYGVDPYVDDPSSVDSKGLSDRTGEVMARINKQ